MYTQSSRIHCFLTTNLTHVRKTKKIVVTPTQVVTQTMSHFRNGLAELKSEDCPGGGGSAGKGSGRDDMMNNRIRYIAQR